MKPLTNTKTLFCFFAILFFIGYQNTAEAEDSRFACGGPLEKQVWQLWDTNVRDYLQRRLLEDRFVKQGDVEALYFYQVNTSNMVAMARRCNRKDRLMEIATSIRSIYNALTPGSLLEPGRRWIQRKGKLQGQEVMLYSVQFLGLATAVANALATSNTPLNNEEKLFIRDTVQIVQEHLLRWNNDQAINKIKRISTAKPEDVKNQSSGLFFTDKSLWQITIYAELAGIINVNDVQKLGLYQLSEEKKKRLRKSFDALLQFFIARTSIRHDSQSRIGAVALADLDRGYWRLRSGNRYAGYESNIKPVERIIAAQSPGKFELKINVPVEKVPIRQDTGWDISHARRLVHALDALDRNRQAIKNIFYLKEKQLPPKDLSAAFANTLIAIIWNGDYQKPLFSNYWSGANGWFRIGYDDKGTGKPSEGVPPYGLTNSFPLGGYVTWAKYNDHVGVIGKRFYDSINSTDPENMKFIDKYYEDFGKTAHVQTNMIAKFTFYSSLVGVNVQ